MVRDGKGGPADAAEALSLFERACTQQRAVACCEGSKLLAGVKGVPKDAKKSKELRERACSLGEAAACGKKKA